MIVKCALFPVVLCVDFKHEPLLLHNISNLKFLSNLQRAYTDDIFLRFYLLKVKVLKSKIIVQCDYLTLVCKRFNDEIYDKTTTFFHPTGWFQNQIKYDEQIEFVQNILIVSH